MSMDRELQDRLTPHLLRDFHFKSSADGAFWQQGVCPQCGKRELWTHQDSPWVLRCNRTNNCGAEISVRDLYPDEFGQFTKRFPVSKTNPTAAADAYMRDVRGLNVEAMHKHKYYFQGSWHGIATVKFSLPNGSSMERLVDSVEVIEADGSTSARKQNFSGPHGGLWWAPRDMTIEPQDRIYMVEGIIDAISLWQHGIKAVALLSCGNYPELSLKPHLEADIEWVLALDNDKAGLKAMLKFAQRLREAHQRVSASLCPRAKKCDWNDLHRLGKLQPEDMAEYDYHGRLLLAPNPTAKAQLIAEHQGLVWFVFDFQNRTYCRELDDNDNVVIRQIANFRLEFLYFVEDTPSDESAYHCRIHVADTGQSHLLAIRSTQIHSNAEFKKRLCRVHGAWWEGGTSHLNWFARTYLGRTAKIDSIDYVGYVKADDAYIFPGWAVQRGKVIAINEGEYYPLAQRNLRSAFNDYPMEIEASAQHYQRQWLDELWDAYGAEGMVVATFWFASLFACQTRAQFGAFPFLEIVGEPGAGKTTLIETLWHCLGQDKEGTEPNKATRIALLRTLMQVSNMPVVLIEGDRDDRSHAKRFDYDDLKALYNGSGMAARAYKNNNNDTKEPPFLGTVVVAQNNPVQASTATLERFVSVRFSKSSHSRVTREAANRLWTRDKRVLSPFVIMATREASGVMDGVAKKTKDFQNAMLSQPGIKNARLALNHALLMAFVEQFSRVFGLGEERRIATIQQLYSLCEQRHRDLGGNHPLVEEFWDAYEYMQNSRNQLVDKHKELPLLNHARADSGEIAINLNEFQEAARLAGQSHAPLRELKQLLRTSVSPKFVEASRTVRSVQSGRNTVRCWIFSTVPVASTHVAPPVGAAVEEV